MIKQKTNSLGFTLLELSIVLVIMGVLLIPALNFLAVSQKASMSIDTRKDLKVISNALSSFYKTNGRLPHPADILLDSSNVNAGKEDVTPTFVDGDTASDADIEYGAVPVEDLGLSHKYLSDAWNYKYSYYVRANTTGTAPVTIASTDDILTYDQNIGRNDFGSAFVVISHGEDGRGAYNRDGTKNPTTGASTTELKNIYSATMDINTSNRLTISDGGINDISVASTGADVVNEMVGHNASGDYFAGNFTIEGGSGDVGIGTSNPYTDLQFSESHYSPGNTDRIINWYAGVGQTEIGNSNIMISTGNNNSSTVQPQSIGLALFNNNTTANVWSPAITFGGLSTSGLYMNGTAAIASQLRESGDGNQKNGDLIFFTKEYQSMQERMRIEDDGDIGIGIIEPNARFHLLGETGVNNEIIFRVEKGYGNGDAFIVGEDASSKVRVGVGFDEPNSIFHVVGTTGVNNEDILKVEKGYGNGTAFMVREDSSGNTRVGIGTPTPNEMLDVNGDMKVNGVTVGTGSAYLGNLAVGQGALNSWTYNSHPHYYNTAIGYEALYNANGLMFQNTAVGYNSMRAANATNVNYNTAIGAHSLTSLTTGQTNTAIGHTAGNGVHSNTASVFLGYSANPSTNGGSYEIVIGAGATGKGSSTIRLGDERTYTLWIGNGGSSIHTSSDRRYKKNITTIQDVLKKINKLDGVYYNWNREKFPEKRFSKKRQIGLIAQEVEKVFPEVIQIANDGYKGIDYSKLTAVLIQASNELAEENKQLNKRLLVLEEKIEYLMKGNNE